MISVASYASDQDDAAKKTLQAQIDLTKTIRSTLERYNAVRATILIGSSQDVIAAIDTYHVGSRVGILNPASRSGLRLVYFHSS